MRTTESLELAKYYYQLGTSLLTTSLLRVHPSESIVNQLERSNGIQLIRWLGAIEELVYIRDAILDYKGKNRG